MQSLFLNLLAGILTWVHPFFISMTDIEYNSNTKKMQISVRIFTDDLEKVLRKNCNCKVDLSQANLKPQMNPLVQQYVFQHLSIGINGKRVPLVFLGFQNEEESTWSYFEVINVNQLRKLSITNTLLHDYKTEQINMLHITAFGKEQTEKLDYPDHFFETGFQ